MLEYQILKLIKDFWSWKSISDIKYFIYSLYLRISRTDRRPLCFVYLGREGGWQYWAFV